ncbi:MAG: SpoIIE family protein phosphatase, partial [Dehalococcoidia bacterium]|nr:SpoIIE family protein phosphatase [Dehalococcoidia bacterium]
MTTWVGRYAMVRGEVHEHGPWLIDRVRRQDEETLRLVILTEPVDERSAEFCHEVAEAIAALFARESLSITGGLLRALRQANTNLAEWNRRSLREHRVAVGVTAVVVRDGEATIVQAGPGVVYVHTTQTTTRLVTEGSPAAAPLGAQEEIEPLFTSAPLQRAQVLLLTTAAEAAVGTRTVQQSLDAGAERALAELFRHTRGVSDMTAVLLADLDIDEEQAAPALDSWDDDPAAVEGREVAFADVDSGTSRSEPARRPRGW